MKNVTDNCCVLTSFHSLGTNNSFEFGAITVKEVRWKLAFAITTVPGIILQTTKHALVSKSMIFVKFKNFEGYIHWVSLQGVLVKWKWLILTPGKSALDDSSAYTTHTKCCWVNDSSRNLGLSWWLIYWLWHCSHKQKAPFPQGVSPVDHQNLL